MFKDTNDAIVAFSFESFDDIVDLIFNILVLFGMIYSIYKLYKFNNAYNNLIKRIEFLSCDNLKISKIDYETEYNQLIKGLKYTLKNYYNSK